jgi:class 3 adenylate cyclase
MDTQALVVFADIRGFTNWAEKNEVFARLGEFASIFLGVFRETFTEESGYFLKGLGDGVMLVREIERNLDAKGATRLLSQLLGLIRQAEDRFKLACEAFAQAIGHSAELRLGWGVVRGAVQKLSEDYLGPNVNKAARLCDQARPFGLVVDREDFSEPPQDKELNFFPQIRKLTGIGEVVVWVTEEVATQSLTRERLRQTPEVHVAGQCIDTSGTKGIKILIAKRSGRRKLFGGRWEGCGGQLAASESFVEGVRRHFQMEMGMQIQVLEDLHCFYTIREPNEPLIPGIRFLCERVDEAEPRSPNHDEIKWVTEKQFRGMADDEFVPNLKEQVLDLLKRYPATKK